jgi:hypothetical protein
MLAAVVADPALPPVQQVKCQLQVMVQPAQRHHLIQLFMVEAAPVVRSTHQP